MKKNKPQVNTSKITQKTTKKALKELTSL